MIMGQTRLGPPISAMEYVEGRPLSSYLGQVGTIRFVIHIAAQMLAALNAAHEQGVVHRDLKPENVMLTTVGKDDVFVKVLDFGLAHLADEESSLTAAGEVFGTPLYMSPEQVNAEEISPATDIYSLGCILYELISGRPPICGCQAREKYLCNMQAAHLPSWCHERGWSSVMGWQQSSCAVLRKTLQTVSQVLRR